MKNKPIVIVDSCSHTYLNLPLSFTERVSLWQLLSRNAHLTCSPEVVSEINRTPSFDPKQALKLDAYRHKFLKMAVIEYEQRLFGRELSADEGDKGERDNFAVALDLFMQGSFGVVFLTDDENHDLLTKFLPGFLPVCQRWTTFDAVLFLYLRESKKAFSKGFAEGAVRDLIAHLREQAFNAIQRQKAGKDNVWLSDTTRKMNERFIALQTQYLSRIDLIFKFLKN